MKRCMIVPIALIATTGNAQSPEDLKIIREVIREVQAVITEEGAIGLQAKSMNYHKVALGKNDWASLIRCLAFDIRSRWIDLDMSRIMNIHPHPYFQPEKISERLAKLCKTRTFMNKEKARTLAIEIGTHLDIEAGKMLSKR